MRRREQIMTEETKRASKNVHIRPQRIQFLSCIVQSDNERDSRQSGGGAKWTRKFEASRSSRTRNAAACEMTNHMLAGKCRCSTRQLFFLLGKLELS